MLTIQILTKNNQQTISKCLESIKPLNPQILVGDLGSEDKTRAIAMEFGAEVVNLGNIPRDEARNSLNRRSKHDVKFIIEPWEVLAKYDTDLRCPSYVSVINNRVLTKQIRVWNTGKFVNPVYEQLDLETEQESNWILYSIGSRNYDDDLQLLELWRLSKPTSPYPYYYESCIRLSRQEYDRFYVLADHYLFLDPKPSMTSIMARYNYAIATLLHKKLVRPTLQNLNLCLCAQPLMAEFWCLMADAYYHLLKKFDLAKCFYENAIILGSRRLKTEKWPMDIGKYGIYPQKMIESCDKIINHSSSYKTQ